MAYVWQRLGDAGRAGQVCGHQPGEVQCSSLHWQRDARHAQGPAWGKGCSHPPGTTWTTWRWGGARLRGGDSSFWPPPPPLGLGRSRIFLTHLAQCKQGMHILLSAPTTSRPVYQHIYQQAAWLSFSRRRAEPGAGPLRGASPRSTHPGHPQRAGGVRLDTARSPSRPWAGGRWVTARHSIGH